MIPFTMLFDSFDPEQQFRRLWNAVRIERESTYSLFTFGDSDLPYYLVTEPQSSGELVKVHRGKVTISRPMLIRPNADQPEFENFFDATDEQEEDFAACLLSRTAAFSNLRFINSFSGETLVSDSSEETVEKLKTRLDDEEEDRVGIIVTQSGLQGFGLMKYAISQVIQSTPDNIQELRERGFLN